MLARIQKTGGRRCLKGGQVAAHAREGIAKRARQGKEQSGRANIGGPETAAHLRPQVRRVKQVGGVLQQRDIMGERHDRVRIEQSGKRNLVPGQQCGDLFIILVDPLKQALNAHRPDGRNLRRAG